jgi:group I intron endonuclease
MYTYRATNTLNGKFYIGSAINFKKRKNEHLRSKDNYPFQTALRNNPEMFDWETWSDDCNQPVLEQALLDMFYGTEQCYNLSPDAIAPMKSKKHSTETKQKQSENNRGKNNPMWGKKRPDNAERNQTLKQRGKKIKVIDIEGNVEVYSSARTAAHLLGVAQSTVQSWVTGKHSPKKICRGYFFSFFDE